MAKTKLLNDTSITKLKSLVNLGFTNSRYAQQNLSETEFLIPKYKFKILVKTNAKKNKLSGFDTEKNAWRIEITALPEKNKANIEIIKFLTKQLGRKVRIVSGLKSREKICEAED